MAAATANNTAVQEIFESAPWRRVRQGTQKDLSPARNDADAPKCFQSAESVDDAAASWEGYLLESEEAECWQLYLEQTCAQASSDQQQSFEASGDLNDDGKDATDDGAEKSTDSEVGSSTDEMDKGPERSEDGEKSTDPEDDGVASNCPSYCETMSHWSEHDENEQLADCHDPAAAGVPVGLEQAGENSPTKSPSGGSSTRWADMDEDDEDFFPMKQPVAQEAGTPAGETRTPLRTPLKKNASLFVPLARPSSDYEALPFLPSTAVADAWQRWHDAQGACHYAGDSYDY